MRTKLSKLLDIMNKVIIVILLLISVFNIFSPFFNMISPLLLRSRSSIQLLHYLEIHRTIRRLLSFIIMVVAWKLYKRMSAAWSIAMIALSMAIFQHLITHKLGAFNVVLLLELIAFFVLLLSKNYYCRRSDKYSVKKGMFIYILFVSFIFLNAAIGFFNIRRLKEGTVSLIVCIRQTFDVIFASDHMKLMIYSQSMGYHKFIFWFSWVCILIGIIMVLTPYISEKLQTQEEIEKARELVKKYGQNCSSYTTLEKDKTYYFGKSVEGYAAYGIVKDTVVVLGDPVCAAKDFTVLLSEFKNYCVQNAYSVIFMNTTGMFLKEYQSLGMGFVKCGEEPRFKLMEYSLAGGAASKTRLNINHATKAGLTILEYEPLKERDTRLEKEIYEVSQEWFSMKKSSELIFSMGRIDFDNPMDRRYFYALNPDGIVEGFIVFVPFAGMNGYMADVTRHRVGATRGVMEKIVYEAFMKFKSEGFEWGSLAVAPLAKLEEEPEVTAKLLNIIYEKMNHVYGFKTLYQTKLKYNPTMWEPSYYVYYPAVFTPAMAYAIIRIQNPCGVMDYVKAFFRNMKKEKTKENPNNEDIVS